MSAGLGPCSTILEISADSNLFFRSLFSPGGVLFGHFNPIQAFFRVLFSPRGMESFKLTHYPLFGIRSNPSARERTAGIGADCRHSDRRRG